MVQDFENATEVPSGAKNLGWVLQPQVRDADGKEDDEATYVQLRKRICEMGGDALSQPSWVQDVEDGTHKLKVNAWLLP
jgi:hypothetical protein